MSGGTGRLTVITGPSGVGRHVGPAIADQASGDLAVGLCDDPFAAGWRAGGRAISFIPETRFDQLVAEDGLLEWAEFAGNCYGTPRQPVMEQLHGGRPVLLEIELEGARQVRKSFLGRLSDLSGSSEF